MAPIMCSIDNGSHFLLRIFLSVIHPLVTLFRSINLDTGQSRGGIVHPVKCTACSHERRYVWGSQSKGDEVGFVPPLYCLAVVDGSVMVIKLAVWMARLL